MRVRVIGPREPILVERELASLVGPLDVWPTGGVVSLSALADGRVCAVVILPEEKAEGAAVQPSTRPIPPPVPQGRAYVGAIPSCPKCGADMVRRQRADGAGTFWGCTAYPSCDGTRALDGLVIGEQKCVLCGGPMVHRRNKATGDVFWGCSGFPHCRGMRPLGDMGERAVPTGLMTVATATVATEAGVQKWAGEDKDGNIPF